MSWLDRAIENTQEILEQEAGEKLVLLMTAAAPCKGSGAVFRRIAQATSAETILDYFAEIRFGLAFKGMRFEIEFEPYGRKGPDLKVIRDGQSTYVEVKRFRPSVADDGPTVGIGDELMPYGNLDKSVKRIEDELAKKVRQVEADSGIVAFWSDHSTVEVIDFELATLLRHPHTCHVVRDTCVTYFARSWRLARSCCLHGCRILRCTRFAPRLFR